jgi:hypothetical protein
MDPEVNAEQTGNRDLAACFPQRSADYSLLGGPVA